MRTSVLLSFAAFLLFPAPPAAADPAPLRYRPSQFRIETGVDDLDDRRRLSQRIVFRVETSADDAMAPNDLDMPASMYAGLKFRADDAVWVAPQFAVIATDDDKGANVSPGLSFALKAAKAVTKDSSALFVIWLEEDYVFSHDLLHGYLSTGLYAGPIGFILPGIGLQLEHWNDAAAFGPHVRIGGDSFFIEAQYNYQPRDNAAEHSGRVLFSFVLEDFNLSERYGIR